jgi:hypothetical protein
MDMAAEKTNGNSKLDVTFDLDNYTGLDIEALQDATSKNNIRGICEFLSKVVKTHPFDGAADDPNTYMKLPLRTTLNQVLGAFNEAAAAATLN